MRSPSSKILPNTVDIYTNYSGTNSEGGIQFTYQLTPNYPQVPCSIQFLGSEEVVDDQNRLTQLNTYRFIFGRPTSIFPRDQLNWIDAFRVTHIAYAEASTDEAYRGSTFTIMAVERI